MTPLFYRVPKWNGPARHDSDRAAKVFASKMLENTVIRLVILSMQTECVIDVVLGYEKIFTLFITSTILLSVLDGNLEFPFNLQELQ